MGIGIVSAVIAGLMLGLYALPGKYVKGFQEENKWSLFFLLTMFVVPLLATLGMMKGVTEIFTSLDRDILLTMVVSSFLWLSLIHISEPTRRYAISYAVFCLKKKK